MSTAYQFCPQCATALALITQAEDGGDKERLRCPACGFTHWNNPTPVLAAIVEYEGKILLARNAAWPGKMYALITGFMEAGETPQEGIMREIAEETNLATDSLNLVGVYDFQRMPGHHRLPRPVSRHGSPVTRVGGLPLVCTARREMLARRHRLCHGGFFACAWT